MSLRQRRRGGNAIEVALTMPVFLAAMFGLMDYAWYFYNEAMTIESTRQGCRVGSVVPEGNTPGPVAVAQDFINADLQASGLRSADMTESADTSWTSASANNESINVAVVGDMLVCDTYMEFKPIVGFVPTPDYVLSSATFELEQPS